MRILFLIHDPITAPLGVGYLSTLARSAGHDVGVAALVEQDPVGTARAFHPDIIAFGSTSGFHRKYLELNAELARETGAVSIMGGAHPTFFPEVVTAEQHPPDFAVRGEGEHSFLAFLEHMEGRRGLDDVGNLLYRAEDGSLRANPLNPLIEDLDTVPYPDRGLTSRFGAWEHRKAVFVITGRGCPYDCSYCFNHSYNELYSGLGTRVRRRSVANVMGELHELRGLIPELQMIVFQDDVFILDHEWVLKFTDSYAREIGLPFHCHLRANLVTREIARALRAAGCVSIKMAIETADDRLRNELLNRRMSRQTIVDACRWVREAGIVLVTQNILGIPTGTLEDDLDTLRLNIECKPAFAFATLLQPYPRTSIGDYCRANGFLDQSSPEAARALPDSFFDMSPLRIDHKRERERLRKLFALAIEFPFLRAFLRTLLRTPLDGLYDKLDKLWKGFCFKFREFPYRLGFGEFARIVLTYFRSRYY
ncbi:B12-binding domain-containing radical SAM protein [Candidatus Fermentibacterales bacterium]|nr:B12-binding domain-containing radical SAM protein [Candidatus Fermentibacterales bacterium]